jgi:hypothetical protein
MYAKQNANAIEPSRTKTSSNCRFVWCFDSLF